MRLGAMALLTGCAASRPDLPQVTPDLQRLRAGKSGCPQAAITISEARLGVLSHFSVEADVGYALAP